MLTDPGFERILADFLMKYIIIGIYCLFTVKKVLQRWLIQEKLEPENRVCCIISPTTHVRPMCDSQTFCSLLQHRQEPFTTYYRGRILK